MSAWGRDLGQEACAAAFVQAVATGGDTPISFAELMDVSRHVIEADRLLRA